jgi:hypothetical protein
MFDPDEPETWNQNPSQENAMCDIGRRLLNEWRAALR